MMFEMQMLGYRFLKAFMKPVVKLVPQPRPVVFVGPDSALRLCSMIGGFGFRRVLIVTDAVLVKIGVVAPLRRALVEQGIDVALFDSILPDPTYPVVRQGHAAALAHQSEAILAVGGGSSIDAAKVIAAMVTSGKPPEKLLGFFRLAKPMLPLFVVPTTAGTGSEVTVAAVLTDPVRHQKAAVVDPRIVPAAAALDPKVMQGMPPPITAATGMDALTHAVEAYLNVWPTAETAFHSVSAVRLIDCPTGAGRPAVRVFCGGRLRPIAPVRSSVPVRKTRVTLERMQVDVGVEGFVIFRSTRADLEDGRCARGSILQVMTIGGASREARAVTAPQQLFAGIGNEYDFAVEDVHELVLHRVPVSLTRPGARRQLEQVHSKLREPGRVA